MRPILCLQNQWSSSKEYENLFLEGVCVNLLLSQFSPTHSTKFQIYVTFSSFKKHAVWGWETEKHGPSSCAMLHVVNIQQILSDIEIWIDG